MVEFRHRGAAGDLPNLAATASGPEPPSRRRERAPANAHLPNLTASTGQKARHRRLLRGGGAPSWAPPAAKGRRAAARGSGAPSWAPAPRDAPSWAPACAALGYPRSLRRVLPDAADREHLKRLYFEHVRGRSPYPTDAPCMQVLTTASSLPHRCAGAARTSRTTIYSSTWRAARRPARPSAVTSASGASWRRSSAGLRMSLVRGSCSSTTFSPSARRACACSRTGTRRAVPSTRDGHRSPPSATDCH